MMALKKIVKPKNPESISFLIILLLIKTTLMRKYNRHFIRLFLLS